MSDKIHKQFADLAVYSETARTAVSVRDGVLEYLGAELGLEPPDKVVTVYRSPATIANAAHAMFGIPLTDEHVSMTGPATDTGSRVESSVVIDQIDEPTFSRLAVQNKLSVNDSLSLLLKDKRQLSLGYEADLVPHSRWDFEQINIVPHHLAAVPAGRCGPLCSFIDRKPDTPIKPEEGETMPKMHKAFNDAEGAVSLEQVVEIATALPEAIRKVPVDKLSELVPVMQEIMSYMGDQGVIEEVEVEETDEEAKGMDATDTDKENDKEDFADSTEFKDAVAKIAGAEVKRYASVVTKARNFLDSDYDFTSKVANEVMRDALATQSSDKFEDAELSVAFKLLRKKESNYQNFGDTVHEASLEARIKQQVEG